MWQRPYWASYSGTYPYAAIDPHYFYVRQASTAAIELSNTMRTLWEQHVAWTRMVIISIAASLPDEAATTERLLRNASEMEAVFKTFYGDKKAALFSKLLTEHLVIAAQLVKAAKAGDQKAVADTDKRWHANADDIASFLSSINPNWPKKDLQAMFYEHLRLTKSEAVNRLQQNYAADIADFDKIEKQALMMADALTNGIVKQFPAYF